MFELLNLSLAIPLAFGAGLSVAFANLCMRRSIDVGSNTNGYLLVQLLISALLATWLHPVQHEAWSVDAPTVGLGLLAGISLGGVLIFMGRSLARGPAGLSVAFINASTLLPAIVMFFIFGPTYGFVFGTKQILASLLVLVGLFWASITTLQVKSPWGWAKAIAVVFFCHLLLLCLFQYRSLLLNAQLPLDPTLLPFHIREADSQWFLPILYLTAWLVQLRVFWTSGSRKIQFREIGYGILGGITNGLSGILIVQAATTAFGQESAVIYPLYSVSIVLVCSLWSRLLYKENVNWVAIAVAAGGIALGAS